ncbi:MAG: hypothetical protein HOW97_27140, partial [Catenulispora sp.]|nr:hypothetical protein [Catenulispora sp.]
IGAVAASVVLAAAVGAACTAWFDGVAGAADRASVVSIAVDSVVDGDPAAGAYDAARTSATAEYVIELANNSPTAVTLDSVGFDAGTLMASTGWKPLGAGKRIAAGSTAKVALTVRLFCPMLMVGVQGGGFGGAGRLVAGSSSSIPFPPLEVRVLDGNGDQRAVTLPTRTVVTSLLRGQSGDLTFLGSGAEPTPQIVTAGVGPCAQWEADREKQQERDLSGLTGPVGLPAIDTDRRAGGLVFAYDKVLSRTATGFTIAVNVRNKTQDTLTVATRADAAFVQDPAFQTEWQPAEVTIPAGQTQQFRLTVTIRECDQFRQGRASRADIPAFAEALLEVNDGTTGMTIPFSPEQQMTGSLRLAGDAVKEIKAVCP